MSNTAKNASEKAFQEKFVAELTKFKWQAPDFLNGNIQKVTVQTLIDNWRNELNRMNADQLEGVELTDGEFKQVLSKVSKINNSYEAAKTLSMEGGKGKIDGIYRDKNPAVTRPQITLTILNKAQVRGGDSSYAIAREVESFNGNRFDMVLLINGLPLINIEQKRSDKSLDEAFGQFMRYYRDGEYTNNFMAFSQMMVITTEIETRYFATPKSIKDFNQSFVFHWADKNNKPINDWQKIVEFFLMIPMAHQMVGDYLVIDEAEDEENRRHMLMRPYQVYALQAVEGAAFGWDNPEHIPHGGFVWHTTGSGKTITSFKTALFLATRAGFDKVIFLVDRRELDKNTSDNFKAYAAYEPVSVDDTAHTYQLRKQLKSKNTGIVVTTTFKLNILVKEMIEADDTSLQDKKIVFIIDEAHRTTMGEMMGSIKEYFKNNSLFFGFTGTPLFDENDVKGMVNEKNEVIKTTEKLFGPNLHDYTINEAIGDGNVLGFNINYINTGEFVSYEDLREGLIEKILEEKPDLKEDDVEEEVQSWDDLKVETEASKKGILIYQDETHIPQVVERIIKKWNDQSQEKEFNAILTVAYKDRVIAYYNEFKKQLKDNDLKLNIAMTFSFGNENDQDNIDPEIIAQMFKDYGSFTGIEFVVGDKKHGEDAYFSDIVDRTKRGGSGRNPKNIDLVIVADQLLTGYDAKRLNTLYVDRSLELQSLIQAYSRTNRVLGPTKEFGKIINFQYPRITEHKVETALRLYCKGGNNTRAIVDPYNTAVEKFNITVIAMKRALADPKNWAELKDTTTERELFLLCYKDAAKQLSLVQQYYAYQWDSEPFGIDEETWLQYVGAYKNLTYKTGPGPVDPPVIIPLPGKTKVAKTQKISGESIIDLIGTKTQKIDGHQTVDYETLRLIYEEIQELSYLGEATKAETLKTFVKEEIEAGNISSNETIDTAFEQWKINHAKAALEVIAKNWGIATDLLQKSYNAYSFASPDVIPYIDEITSTVDFDKALDTSAGNKLKHNMELIKHLPTELHELKMKFE